MNINYLSDLHLEFGPLPCTLEGEVLVLAGDVDVKARTSWIKEVASRFEHVIYVLGNHEFYKGDLHATLDKIRDNLPGNVHLLQNESIEIKGSTFHGMTLWTNLNNMDPLTVNMVQHGLNDFRLIRKDRYANRFTAMDSLTEHNISVLYLMENVKPGDVIVTHHAPSFKSIHSMYKNDFNLNGGFVSDLSNLIFDLKPSLWIHGHVHTSFNYQLGTTRVVCNPRGYAPNDANPVFNIDAVMSV